MTEPVWLTTAQVILIHDRQLAVFGGLAGLRDEGALESAIGRPRNRWLYEAAELPELGASYAFGLARNHPFVDGNKRAAFLSAAAFLLLNDVAFEPDPDNATRTMVALAAGKLDEDEFAAWIRANIRN